MCIRDSFPDSAMIDSLLEMTGYEKVTLSDEGKVVKTDLRIMLSCGAVAKGYAVDLIAQRLKKKGIRNFMFDIGGEVVVHGQNPQNDGFVQFLEECVIYFFLRIIRNEMCIRDRRWIL